MTKDPAFLFYSQDFFLGSATLSFEDKGKYIHLLCLMHQQGRMDEETIRFTVGYVSVKLKSKFKVDENGFWYNERLENEIEKRNKFTKSRLDNGLKGGRPKNKKTDRLTTRLPVAKPTNNLPENENDNEIEDINKDVFTENSTKHWESEKNTFLNAGNWIFKFCTDKKIKVEIFDTLANEFISDVELKEDFKTVKELRNHFTNWYNLKSKSNGADQRITERHRNGKNAGAFQLLESLREDLRNG